LTVLWRARRRDKAGASAEAFFSTPVGLLLRTFIVDALVYGNVVGGRTEDLLPSFTFAEQFQLFNSGHRCFSDNFSGESPGDEFGQARSFVDEKVETIGP
jgi:hypothetical protein